MGKDAANTELLLLDRALGRLEAEDYVAWAVARLVAGDDTPDLRVLAGLVPKFDREEVEKYFLRTCMQLAIDVPNLTASWWRDAAKHIRRLFDAGKLSATQVVDRMAQLYVDSGYSDPLLGVWYNIAEELAWLNAYETSAGFWYPHPLGDLNAVVRHEWSLFDLGALDSEVPAKFAAFIRCEDCGHIGEPVLRRKTFLDAISSVLPWVRLKPPLWVTCSRCGSFDYRSITDPEVRADYFARSETS